MDIAREGAAVVFVLALLGGVFWAMRRGVSFKGSARTRRLESIERVVLTPQHALHLVRFGGEEMVVSTHPRGCSILAKEAAAGAPPGSHTGACA